MRSYPMCVQEETGSSKEARTQDRKQQRSQSQLITFAIKVMIMMFVFFDLLEEVGIHTSDMLQITTVFSLGLSWSMRDWLASLWASFMIAFTTDLTVGSEIKMGNNGNVGRTPDGWLKVKAPGLIFTVCCLSEKSTTQEIYIPNSAIVSGGFVIKSS